MEDRDINMTEVKDTPLTLLTVATDVAQKKSKKLVNLTRTELQKEATTLIVEKEYLKATIKFLRDRIIKNAGNNG